MDIFFDVKTIIFLFVIYIILRWIGKYKQNKTFEMFSFVMKMAALTLILVALLINDLENVLNILKTQNLSTLDASSAVIFIVLILAAVDIFETLFDMADVK